MAKWTFLFSHLIHFLMEKKFPFFEKTILKRLGKYPLRAGVSLYMLGPNRDDLSIGGVRLVWRGYCAICRALYGGMDYGTPQIRENLLQSPNPFLFYILPCRFVLLIVESPFNIIPFLRSQFSIKSTNGDFDLRFGERINLDVVVISSAMPRTVSIVLYSPFLSS